jgi:prevent-host-death family protein
MSIQMNIAEAKAKLSELIARAEAGEQVVIARDGRPVVALAPVQVKAPATRTLGLWDEVGAAIPEDLFLGPDSEIQKAMASWESAAIQPAP